MKYLYLFDYFHSLYKENKFELCNFLKKYPGRGNSLIHSQKE